MNWSSEPSMTVRRLVTISVPRAQVIITVNTEAAIKRGTQAPWGTFVRFEANNVISIPPNTIPATTSFSLRQCQRARATTRNRDVVITNVPVTATP